MFKICFLPAQTWLGTPYRFKYRFIPKYNIFKLIKNVFSPNSHMIGMHPWVVAGLHRAAQVGFLCAQICGKAFRILPLHNVYIGQFFSFRPRAVGHIVQPRDRHIIEHIWKYTLEKSRTNATSVSLAAMIQVLWGLIWNYTVEKSQTNATSATTFPLKQSIWGHI